MFFWIHKKNQVRFFDSASVPNLCVWFGSLVCLSFGTKLESQTYRDVGFVPCLHSSIFQSSLLWASPPRPRELGVLVRFCAFVVLFFWVVGDCLKRMRGNWMRTGFAYRRVVLLVPRFLLCCWCRDFVERLLCGAEEVLR